ncbi:MAG: hypothetical protein ACP5D6_11175, partial [Kosmotogaceae bacterium]
MRNEEIREITGLTALLQKMNCSSVPGKKHVTNIKFYRTKENIKKELDALDSCLEYFNDEALVNKIKKLLSSLRDISDTLKKMESSDCIFDDIQLFELKEFSMLSEETRQVMNNCPEFLELKKLDDVVKLLDPENTKLKHFYIYDAYDKELEKLRTEKKKFLRTRTNPEKLRKIEMMEEEIEEN